MATAEAYDIIVSKSDFHTISRVPGELGLVLSGINDPNRFQKMREEHRMTPYYKFLNPENAKKFDRPTVDLSRPRNLLDENDHVASEAGMSYKGAYFSFNPGHMSGVQEPVPYVYTHHNFDFLIHGVLGSMTLFLNWYISRTQNGGSILGHPHTQWAHNVVFGAGMIRSFAAAMIGVGGSLYLYEFLYTHVPYFKIDDPSTNGWTRPWEPNQSTFAARAVSMAMLPTGAAFFTGTFKRFHFNLAAALFAGSLYESFRYFGGANRFALRDKFMRENDKQGAAGNLDVNIRKTSDYTTGLMPNELNTKYVNSTQLTLKEMGWVENCFDNLPLNAFWRKERNHRFNWTFAKNSKGERAYKYKNEMWELPGTLLEARTHTDVYDKVKTESRLAREARQLSAAAL